MISEIDRKRVLRLRELDQQRLLGDYLMQLSYEFRDRSAGREPDPRDGPDIAPVLRAYSLAYLPPRDLAEKEVLYQIFPHHRVRVADEVLFTFPIQE